MWCVYLSLGRWLSLAKVPSETKRVPHTESESPHTCVYLYLHTQRTHVHTHNYTLTTAYLYAHICPVHTTHLCMCTQNRYVCVLHNYKVTPHTYAQLNTHFHHNRILLCLYTYPYRYLKYTHTCTRGPFVYNIYTVYETNHGPQLHTGV